MLLNSNQFSSFAESNELFDEIKSLEKWTETINMPCNDQSFINKQLVKRGDLIRCQSNDITGRKGVFKNDLSSPMELTSGIFRNMYVSLRRNRVDNLTTQSINIPEIAAKRDLEILR